MRVSGLICTLGALMCSLFSGAQVVDALIVEPGDNPVIMYRNNGSAFFDAVVVQLDLNANLDARCLVLGDFDQDSDLDVMIGYISSNKVWLNDGFGNFTDTNQLLGSSNTVTLKAGDLDGDGDLDVISGNWGAANKIWINDGAGTFTESTQIFSTTTPAEGEEPVADTEDTRAIDLGDLDGDGDLDIMQIDLNSNGRTQIWTNDGAANYTYTETNMVLGSYDAFDLSLGDLDGDGDLDVFFAMINDTPNLVFLNDGAGNFTSSGQQLANSRSSAVLLGDLDADGDLDALVANSDFHCDGANHIWINDGTGNFTSGQYFGNSPSLDAALGDFDGDGDLDVVVANRGTAGWPNRVWINDGTGHYSDNGQRIGTGKTARVATGNLRSSEAAAARRMLVIPQYEDFSGPLTLVLENADEGPQSMRVDAYSDEGDRLSYVNLTFQPGETQLVDLSYFENASALVFSAVSPVKAYLQTRSRQTMNEITSFNRDWSFSEVPQLETTYFISNPQAVEAHIRISVGIVQRQDELIIPPLGSRALTLSSKTRKKGNHEPIVFKSNIPVAVLSTQRFPETPDLLLPQQALP